MVVVDRDARGCAEVQCENVRKDYGGGGCGAEEREDIICVAAVCLIQILGPFWRRSAHLRPTRTSHSRFESINIINTALLCIYRLERRPCRICADTFISLLWGAACRSAAMISLYIKATRAHFVHSQQNRGFLRQPKQQKKQHTNFNILHSICIWNMPIYQPHQEDHRALPSAAACECVCIYVSAYVCVR